MNVNKIIKIIRQGGVGVLPTDTLYGLVGRALDREVVERIYRIKGRNKKKPFIILISALKDLKKFGVTLPLLRGRARRARGSNSFLRKFWPGPVSIVLPCPSKKFQYLHRGKKTLAFRLPEKKSLLKILRQTGPLVAPSANLSGRPPTRTIAEARRYFGNKVDFYVNAGRKEAKPSKIVSLLGPKPRILRR